MKKFFWKDKSGRGETATCPQEWALEWDNDLSWDGMPLHEFVEEAEEGDEWEDETNKIICISN